MEGQGAWGDYSLLLSSFQSLFALALNKEANTVDVWDALKDFGGGFPVSLDPLMIES